MGNRYERMGVFVSDVNRSVVGVSLREKGTLSLEELKQEASTRLREIGRELCGPEELGRHLRELEKEGFIEREEKFQLTDEGRQVLEEFTSPF